MKVGELLFEVKIGTSLGNPKEFSKYWAVFNKDTLYTYPFYGHGYYFDLRTYFNDGEYPDWDRNPELSDEENAASFEKFKAGSKAAENFIKFDHSYSPSYGHVEIDNDKKIVNLDTSKSSSYQNRRPNSKLANFKHNPKDAYPILQGSPGVERLTDIIKIFKALIKFDERTAKYEVIGDDRLYGYTVETVISGDPEIKKQMHSQLFSAQGQEISFYHGTSMKRAKNILKVGLNPGHREEAYADLITNYSENNIYLSLNPATAANYATREAINDSSDAVILKVTLKGLQIDRVIPDEDSMHWLDRSVPKEYYDMLLKKNPILLDIWGEETGSFNVHLKNINHKDKKFNLMWIFYQGNDEMVAAGKAAFKKYGLDIGYDKNDNKRPTDPKVLALEKKIYRDIMKTYIEGAFQSSVKKLGNVAYSGKIASTQVELFKTWTIKGTKIPINPRSEQYDAAFDAQAASVKRFTKK